MNPSISKALHDLAWAAKEAAADGNKTLAFGNALRSGIGAPPYRRVTRRNGIVVASATQTDPIANGVMSLLVPSTGIVLDYIVAANITSGTWTHSIEKYTDSRYSITVDVTQAGGTDILALSASLTDGGQLAHAPLTISLPNFDSTGTASYPDSSDPRTIFYFDAQLPLNAQPAAVTGGFGGQAWPQFNGNWFVGAVENPPTSGNRMAQVPEPGGYTNNGILQFVRTTDPVNSAKQCFRHRIAPPIDLFAGDTVRSAYLTPDQLPYNVEMWLAFAVRFGGWPTRTLTFFDIHDNAELPGPYGRISPHRQSPVQCWLESDGKYTWGVNGCYKPNYVREDTVISLQPAQGPVSAGSSTASPWTIFAVNFKLGRSLADGPFARIYRSVGPSFATNELVHDISGVPIGYYDTPVDRCFGKLGEYQWSVTQGYYDPVTSPNPCSDFTLETKGLFMYRAEAGSVPINANAMIALVRSKL